MYLEKVKKNIAVNKLIADSDSLLLAVSGGKDSMCLSYILEKLGYKFAVAHCNFGLRDNESDEDAVFVKEYFQNKNIETHSIKFDTADYAQKKGLNIQLAARKLRYDWFDELTTQFHYLKIITAHHANDTIETVLYNMSRGTGLAGVIGIPVENGKVIRPMLTLKSEEIEEIVRKNKIPFRMDSSNSSDKYARNNIRNNIITPFKNINKSFENDFLQTISNLQNANDLLKEFVAREIQKFCTKDQWIWIEKGKLLDFDNHALLLYECIRNYGFNHSQTNNILASKTGIILKSETHEMLNDRDFILIRKIENRVDIPFYLNKTGVFLYQNLVIELTKTKIKNTLQIPLNDKTFPIVIRNWKQGDNFKPEGMKGKSKKLSDLFNDLKINRFEKENIKILESNGVIISVVGYRNAIIHPQKSALSLFISIQ
jgi:tRNA(Ile)-lysidine synthase